MTFGGAVAPDGVEASDMAQVSDPALVWDKFATLVCPAVLMPGCASGLLHSVTNPMQTRLDTRAENW